MTNFSSQEAEFQVTNQHGKTYSIIEKSEDKASCETQSTIYTLHNEITSYWTRGGGPAKKLMPVVFLLFRQEIRWFA